MWIETFDGAALDPMRWIDHYLPQWTTPERSRARYALTADGLRLRIDAAQPAWREDDGPMRVSSLQTGTWSGRIGSRDGPHRHRPDGLVVLTPQPRRPLWTASEGSVTVTMSGTADPTLMLAAWLVGFDDPHAGELCIAELWGDRLGAERSVVRLGLKAHGDPGLVDEVESLVLPMDATDPHAYGVCWDGRGARFTVDGVVVKSTPQVLAEPMMLLVDLFEFPTAGARPAAEYPKTAVVHRVAADARAGPDRSDQPA